MANYTYPNGDEIGIFVEKDPKGKKYAFCIDSWYGKDGEDGGGGWIEKSDYKYRTEREAAENAFDVVIVYFIVLHDGKTAVAFKHMKQGYLSPQLSLPFF